MRIEVVPAGEQDKPVVRNLGRLYIYDFSEFMGLRCPDGGMFECTGWCHYWEKDHHWPFLVRADGELAGFALVCDVTSADEYDHDMGEFFVLRKFRRKGVGKSAAFQVFDRLPGAWEVRQIPENRPAIAFWRAVIGAYTGARCRESLEYFPRHKREMNVIRFSAERSGG